MLPDQFDGEPRSMVARFRSEAQGDRFQIPIYSQDCRLNLRPVPVKPFEFQVQMAPKFRDNTPHELAPKTVFKTNNMMALLPLVASYVFILRRRAEHMKRLPRVKDGQSFVVDLLACT